MGVSRVLPFAAALLVASGGGEAVAEAALTRPQVVSPPGMTVTESAVGAGGGRTAILMAGSTGGRPSISARIGSAARVGPLIRLSERRGSGPAVSVGADGTVVAAWVEREGVRAAIARPGRSFGSVQTIKGDPGWRTAGADILRTSAVAVAPSGRAVITWRAGRNANVAVAAVAPAGGSFGHAVTLGDARTFAPTAAVGLGGAIVVGWLDTPGPPLPPPSTYLPGPAYVRVMTLQEGASVFTGPVVPAAVGYWPTDVSTAAGPGGGVVSWWQDGWMRTAGLGLPVAFAATTTSPTRRSDGSFSATTDASGATVGVWRDVTYAGGDDLETVTDARVSASVAPPGGMFGAVDRLSAPGMIADRPVVATMPDRTLVVWEERDGTRRARIRGAFRRPGRGWAVLRGLRIPAPNTQAGLSVRASADAHHAAVTWITSRANAEFGGPLSLSTYLP